MILLVSRPLTSPLTETCPLLDDDNKELAAGKAEVPVNAERVLMIHSSMCLRDTSDDRAYHEKSEAREFLPDRKTGKGGGRARRIGTVQQRRPKAKTPEAQRHREEKSLGGTERKNHGELATDETRMEHG